MRAALLLLLAATALPACQFLRRELSIKSASKTPAWTVDAPSSAKPKRFRRDRTLTQP